MADLKTGNSRHKLAERKNDLYESPPEAVRSLLAVEHIADTVWEPACGPGSIVTTLRDAGRTVIATDLVDYGCPGQQSGRDFLFEQTMPAGCDTVVTNPPYKLAAPFVRHALIWVPRKSACY